MLGCWCCCVFIVVVVVVVIVIFSVVVIVVNVVFVLEVVDLDLVVVGTGVVDGVVVLLVAIPFDLHGSIATPALCTTPRSPSTPSALPPFLLFSFTLPASP